LTQKSWIVKIEDIKDCDLSAKNPNKVKEDILRSPQEIYADIEKNNEEINRLMDDLKEILK